MVLGRADERAAAPRTPRRSPTDVVEHAAADAVAGLEHEHVAVALHELARGRQAGEPGADHHHVDTARHGPAPPAPGRFRARHARRQSARARERARFEQLPSAEDPVVHSAREVTIRPVTLDAVREEVAAASRRLAAEGLVVAS